MWRKLRDELHPKGVELVTVGLDALGAEGCRPFIEAAQPTHPSLIDQHHVLARLFGVINIPSSIWIDEAGMIVRPAEVAPAPPKPDAPSAPADMPQEMPKRFKAMMGEVVNMPNDTEPYHVALNDWVEKGADSDYALSPEQVVERSRPRTADIARGHAHFELATHLETRGDHEAAIGHYREAHRLVPNSWTFRRQAWSLEKGSIDGPMTRFWQGPSDADPDAWPYEGDWLTDIRREGAENYNERFRG